MSEEFETNLWLDYARKQVRDPSLGHNTNALWAIASGLFRIIQMMEQDQDQKAREGASE